MFSFSYPLVPAWAEAPFGSDDLQRDFREAGAGLGACSQVTGTGPQPGKPASVFLPPCSPPLPLHFLTAKPLWEERQELSWKGLAPSHRLGRRPEQVLWLVVLLCGWTPSRPGVPGQA